MRLFQSEIQYMQNQQVSVDYISCVPDESYPNSEMYCYHDFFEVELFLEADGIHYINAIPYSVKKGYIFLLFPGDYHAYTLSTESQLKMYNIKFNRKFINPELTELLRSHCYPCSMVLDEETLRQVQEEIYLLLKYTDFQTDNPLMQKNIIERMVIYLIDYLKNKTSVSEPAEITNRLRAVTEYIEQHYQEKIELSTIAQYAGVSEKYFGIFFKRNTKMNFSDYLTRVRLAHAKELLKDTQLYIKEISAKVGFNSPEYMAQQFMKRFGVTPTQYRAQKIEP